MQNIDSTQISIQQCARRAFGISIGNLFLGFFGMAWIVLGMWAARKLDPLALALLSGYLALIVVASIYIMRRSYGPLDRSEANRKAQKRINRQFGLVNFLQWALIFAAISGLPHLGLSRWILPAVILIIGIHFFPLARLFQARIHYLNGSVIIAWAIIYPILFTAGKGDSVGAIGMGAILWASVAFACWRGFYLLRQMPVRPRR